MKYFACLVLILYLFIFTPPVSVSAISNNVVIYQVQTGSPASASQEIVLLINTSTEPVNVSDWCLFYSSASNATVRTLACIDTPLNTELWLESNGLISFASGEFVIANAGFVPDGLFTSGLAAGGGHVWIEDSSNITIDRLGWGTATLPETMPATVHVAGNVLSRDTTITPLDTDNNSIDFSSQLLLTPITSGLYEVEVIIDECPNIAEIQIELPLNYLKDDIGDCYEDVCTNLDDLQIEVPVGYEMLESSCSLTPLEDSVILITEILPNATSSDTGKEFIEIYNPNSWLVDLEGYKIQIGPGFTKQFNISNKTIGPGEYLVFSDSISKLVLPNTTGVQLRLVTPAGSIVSETPTYANAPENSSWSLYQDQWIFSNQPTPNGANQPYLEPAQDEELSVTTVLAPCPLGKYRNPETNRCRNIETAVSSLAPCDEDEYRNPDTNRCRKVATASVLAACAEGQERNPETNRCRKIATLAATDIALTRVDDVQVENTPGQVNWFVISIALMGTLGYIVYEWRNEINHYYQRMRRNLVQ